MPEKPAPAGPPAPAPSPTPAPAPAPQGLKCPGCDNLLDKVGYCKTCDAKVDEAGDLVPVGLVGRVVALEGDQDRTNKLGRIFEKGLGLDLDTIDPETFGPLDLVKAAKAKLAEDPDGEKKLQEELSSLIPEELRGLFG